MKYQVAVKIMRQVKHLDMERFPRHSIKFKNRQETKSCVCSYSQYLKTKAHI